MYLDFGLTCGRVAFLHISTASDQHWVEKPRVQGWSYSTVGAVLSLLLSYNTVGAILSLLLSSLPGKGSVDCQL